LRSSILDSTLNIVPKGSLIEFQFSGSSPPICHMDMPFSARDKSARG